jgi:ABC-2 type transport system permease protein
MSLWRVEWLRLVRTRRVLVLAGVFLFFGLLGPVTAAYMEVLLHRIAGDVPIEIPPPTPAAGLEQYMNNAMQIGLLVVLAIAAGALVFDRPPERAAFYRARVGAWSLLAPRYTMAAAAACGAFILGTLGAWAGAAVLLGPLAVGRLLLGVALVCLYLAFAVAVTALAAGLLRGAIAVIALSAGVLLTFPILGILAELRPWLPSHLIGSLARLADGADPAGYVRAVMVTIVATAVMYAAAGMLLDRREV